MMGIPRIGRSTVSIAAMFGRTGETSTMPGKSLELITLSNIDGDIYFEDIVTGEHSRICSIARQIR